MKYLKLTIGISMINLVSIGLMVYIGTLTSPLPTNTQELITNNSPVLPSPSLEINNLKLSITPSSPSPLEIRNSKLEISLTPSPTPDTRCLVQIDGTTFNVSQLRTTHSGGNIFTCGTDMSAIFWNQHGQSILSQMQKYRI